MKKPRPVVIIATFSALSLWLLGIGTALAHAGEDHSNSGLTLFQTYGQFALVAVLGLAAGLALLRARHGQLTREQQPEPGTDQSARSQPADLVSPRREKVHGDSQ